jgi:hypothetical protein
MRFRAIQAYVTHVADVDGDGELEIVKGDLAAMLAAASPKAEAEDLRRQVTVVAGACNRRCLARWWTAA